MTKIKVAIKNRWTGSIIFEYEKEGNTLKDTVAEYIRQARENDTRANLTDADLTRADLTRADLTRANLTDANLTDANLTDANLTRANLTRADLTDANLTRANLTRANLTDANLTDANLTDANLTRANLTDANLTRADLTDANLTVFKYDFWAKLLMLKNEIPAFKEELKAGRVKGTCYEGDCSCFLGTFAKIKKMSYKELTVKPDSDSPTERWFLQIKEGDTPENSGVVKMTMEWIEEFEMYLAA